MKVETYQLLRQFPSLVHGYSLRHGGVSSGHLDSLNLGLNVNDKEENIQENYRRFCEAIEGDMNTFGDEREKLTNRDKGWGKSLINPEKIITGNQVHGDKIARITEKELAQNFNIFNLVPETDGLITNLAGVPLSVRFADCQGVLLFDPVQKAIGAVHCGWRGNTKNIVGKAVARMVAEFNCAAGDILVVIGASLGPCCAEFSNPAEELPGFMQKYVDGQQKVDLWQCSKDQLLKAGIAEGNIEIARVCTLCNRDRYFSFRGGKRKTGHMAAVIMLSD